MRAGQEVKVQARTRALQREILERTRIEEELRHVTVLLVDDEPEVRRIVRLMFEHRGVTVLDAREPEEALEFARAYAGKIDVLVADVVMPRQNGKQLSEPVRALRPDICVLFISGYSAEVLSDRDLLHSGASLLSKPLDANTLVSHVVELPKRPRDA